MEKNMVKAVDKARIKPLGLNLRYERKFIYEQTYLDDLIQDVLANSYCFKEVYHRRSVNNIYFDDNKFNYFHQNVSGDGKREKCRLRWYGDEMEIINNPTFEIKKKFGEVGDKISYKIKDYQNNLNTFNINEFDYLLHDTNDKKGNFVISKFHQLIPTLYNSYERRYFLSFCGRFRITLDYNMIFFNPNHKNFFGSKMSIDEKEIILELKYDLEHDHESRSLSQQFTQRLSKNSKYVRGIELVYN